MTTAYDFRSAWTRQYLDRRELTSPSEYVIRILYVIRIFKGSYPRLTLREQGYAGKRICDVGCGNGVNLAFLKSLGLDIAGVEVSESLAVQVQENLRHLGVSDFTVRAGTNAAIPFEDGAFDFLLSWNACYYMGESTDFAAHVDEFARVLKPGGTLVLSIPKKSCFIFEGSDTLKPGYQIIRNDPFGIRNGEVLRMFEDAAEIAETFGTRFTQFATGDIHDDCFGYAYHWHLAVCRKKGG